MIVFIASFCYLQLTYDISSFLAVTPADSATSDFHPVISFSAAAAAVSIKARERLPH